MDLLNEEKQRALLYSINEGDAKAYNSIYKEYYELMVLYAYKLTGNNIMSEDIVQDIFISIWERRVQFDSHRSIKMYLYRSVHNRCINYNLHPNSHHISLEEKDLAEEKSDIPEYPFMEEEIYRQMFRAIDRLPKRCREVILKSLEGKKNSEIANEMSLSVETIKTQKRRGMEALQRIMRQKNKKNSFSCPPFCFFIVL